MYKKIIDTLNDLEKLDNEKNVMLSSSYNKNFNFNHEGILRNINNIYEDILKNDDLIAFVSFYNDFSIYYFENDYTLSCNINDEKNIINLIDYTLKYRLKELIIID